MASCCYLMPNTDWKLDSNGHRNSHTERKCVCTGRIALYQLLVVRFRRGKGQPLSASRGSSNWRYSIDLISAEGAVMDGGGQKNKVSCRVFSMTLHCVTACGHVDTAAGKTTHKMTNDTVKLKGKTVIIHGVNLTVWHWYPSASHAVTLCDMDYNIAFYFQLLKQG